MIAIAIVLLHLLADLKVFGSYSHLYLLFGHLLSSESSPELYRYADYLKAVYSLYPVARSDKFPATSSNLKVFIKLALVKKQRVSRAEADNFTRLTLQGDVDQILQDKEPIEMDDILKDDKVRLVVVEGAPGIGKSTLAWELCRQWDTLESLKRFSLVVLLRLREEGVQSATDISDLFPCGDDPGLSSLVAEEVKQQNGNRVLFVMDGFDEYPRRLRKSLNSTVMKVIAGELLPKATVIVTSRPAAMADLKSASISKHIEIVGFSGTEIQSYAESIFGNSSKILDSFNSYLSANPVVKWMMYNPLNCAIVVGIYWDIYESGRPVPHTQTELYTDLTWFLLSRYLRDDADPLVGKLPDKLEDLPHDSDLYQQLVKVGQLAFKGNLREEVIFKQLPEGYSDLGLLVEHTDLYTLKKTSTYTFFHLTLQEYMSAFYISQLNNSEQRSLFADSFLSMNVVWRFVAGLTKMENIGWDEVKRLGMLQENNSYYGYKVEDDVASVSSFFIQCVYEAQDFQSCERVFGQHQLELLSISHFDFFALGYCVSRCNNTWNNINSRVTPVINSWFMRPFGYGDGEASFMWITFGIEDLEELEMLSHGMNSADYGGGSIKQLSLHMYEEFIQEHFLQIPYRILQLIESLFVGGDNVRQRGFKDLAECIPYLHSLTSLNISGNPGGDGNLVKLLQALKKHGKLQTLYMNEISIGMDDVAALVDLVKSSSNLRELVVGNRHRQRALSPDVEQQLVKTVLSPSSLETVWVRTDLIHPLEYLETISDSITYLALVSIPNIDLTPKYSMAMGANKLSYILRKNTSLKELDLLVPLNNGTLHDLLESLKDNRSLEKLKLSHDFHSGYISKSENRTMDPRIVYI